MIKYSLYTLIAQNSRRMTFLLLLFIFFANTIIAQKITKQWLYNRMAAKQKEYLEKKPSILRGDSLPLMILNRVDTNVRISNTPETESEIHAAINPKDSNNIIVSAMSFNTAGSLVFRIYYTKNFGKTWQLSSFTGIDPLGFNLGGGDPVLAFDKNGKAYFTWLLFEVSIQNLFVGTSIYGATSDDGGVTWQKMPKPVDSRGISLTASTLVDKEWLAADVSNTATSGNVYVPYALINQVDTTFSILMKRKLANSTLFDTTTIRVSHDSLIASDFPSIDVDSHGYIHVVFASATLQSDNIAIYYCRSTDAGKTFSPAKKITDIQIPCFSPNQSPCSIVGYLSSRIYPCPHIKVDKSGGIYNDRIYVTWEANGRYTKETNGLDIYFSASSDNGATWSTARVVNDDTNKETHQFHPSLTVTEGGILAVTWYDRREDSRNVDTKTYMAISRNGGTSFEPNIVVSSAPSNFATIGIKNDTFGIGEYACVIASKNFIIPFWADGRTNDGNIEIYTSFIPVNKTTTSTNDIRSLSAQALITQISPNPALDFIQIDLECIDPILHLTATITNSIGQVVAEDRKHNFAIGKQSFKMATYTLPNGIYFLSLQNEKGKHTRQFVVNR